MQFLIIFASVLALTFALPSNELKPRKLVVPAGRPEGRITHGHNATDGQFPYQVGQIQTDRNGIKTWCGGSVLNNEWILTAAHCVDTSIEIEILLGATNRHYPEVRHKVTKENVIIHAGWQPPSVASDIALIKIPFTKYSKKIQPTKLPAISTSYSDYSVESVIASGWGRISTPVLTLPDQLQWIQRHVCSKSIKIMPSNICTDTPNSISICFGDSGGPLVLESNGIQVGITSYISADLCEESKASFFTRVTFYLDWIKDNTGVFH